MQSITTEYFIKDYIDYLALLNYIATDLPNDLKDWFKDAEKFFTKHQKSQPHKTYQTLINEDNFYSYQKHAFYIFSILCDKNKDMAPLFLKNKFPILMERFIALPDFSLLMIFELSDIQSENVRELLKGVHNNIYALQNQGYLRAQAVRALRDPDTPKDLRAKGVNKIFTEWDDNHIRDNFTTIQTFIDIAKDLESGSITKECFQKLSTIINKSFLDDPQTVKKLLGLQCIKDIKVDIMRALGSSKGVLLLSQGDLNKLCSAASIDSKELQLDQQTGETAVAQLSDQHKLRCLSERLIGAQYFTKDSATWATLFKLAIPMLPSHFVGFIESLLGMGIFDEATLEKLCTEHFQIYKNNPKSFTPFESLNIISMYSQDKYPPELVLRSCPPLDQQSQEAIVNAIKTTSPRCAAMVLSRWSNVLITLEARDIDRFKHLRLQPEDVEKLRNGIISYLKDIPAHFALDFIKTNYKLLLGANKGPYKSLCIDDATIDEIFKKLDGSNKYYESHQVLEFFQSRYIKMPELLKLLKSKHIALLLSNISPFSMKNMPEFIPISMQEFITSKLVPMLTPDDFCKTIMPFVLCREYIKNSKNFYTQQQWLTYISKMHPNSPDAFDLNAQIAGKDDDGFKPHKINQDLVLYTLAAQYCSKWFGGNIALPSSIWTKKIIYAMGQLANYNQISAIQNDIVKHLFAGFENKELIKQLNLYDKLDNPERIALFKKAAKKYQGELFFKNLGFEHFGYSEQEEQKFIWELYQEHGVPTETYVLEHMKPQEINNLSINVLQALDQHLTHQKQLLSNMLEQLLKRHANKPQEEHEVLAQRTQEQLGKMFNTHIIRDKQWPKQQSLTHYYSDLGNMYEFLQNDNSQYLQYFIPNYSEFNSLLDKYHKYQASWSNYIQEDTSIKLVESMLENISHKLKNITHARDKALDKIQQMQQVDSQQKKSALNQVEEEKFKDDKSYKTYKTYDTNNLSQQTGHQPETNLALKQQHIQKQKDKKQSSQQQNDDKTQLDKNYVSIDGAIYKVMSTDQNKQKLPQGVLPIYHVKSNNAYFGFSPELYETLDQTARDKWAQILSHGFVQKNAQSKYGIKCLGSLVEAVNPEIDDRLYTDSYMKIGDHQAYLFGNKTNHKQIKNKNNPKKNVALKQGAKVAFLTKAAAQEIEQQIYAVNQQDFEEIESQAGDHNQYFKSPDFASEMQKLLNNNNNQSYIDDIIGYKSEEFQKRQDLAEVLEKLGGDGSLDHDTK